MIKGNKKLILILSLLAVTICSPIYANADDTINTETEEIALSYMDENVEFINNEGKIKNTIFYKDGKYLYSGCKAVNDKDGLYYNDGNKDKFLGDYDSSDFRVFGSKYTVISKDGEEFLVDLSTGEILNDETLSDKMNSIASLVKDQLTETDRYGQFEGNVEIKELGMNRYMNPMYQYFAVPTDDSNGKNDTAYIFDNGKLKTGLFGFTNEDGNYIDITKIANIHVYSSKLNSICEIERYNEVDDESGIIVRLTGQAKPLCEDENYLYVMVGVSIEDTNESSSKKGTTVYAFIQKISKDAGEMFDGAYLPQSVESYEVTSQYNFADDDEGYNDIFNLSLLAASNDKNYNRAPFNAACSIKDGYIYITQINNDKNKVKVNKIKLAKENVVYNSGGMQMAGSMDIGYRPIDTNAVGSFDAYVAEFDANPIEQDITKFSNFSPVSVSSMKLAMILAGFSSSPAVFPDLPVGTVTIDNSGDIWVLNNGDIMKYSEEDNEFKTIYTCDSSMNKIKVYDEDNIIVWNEDNNIYSVIKDGKYKKDIKSEEDPEEDDDKKETGSITIDGVVYKLYEEHAEAVDYVGWNSIINLPGEISANGKKYTVTKIADNAFEYSNTIIEFVIPDSVKVIGKEAFKGTNSLKRIKMGNGVKVIEEGAFIYCVGLEKINLSNELTTIKSNAFEHCESIGNLVISSKVKNIEKEAFKDCKSIETISMGNDVVSIGEYAFWGCDSLKTINISKNLKAISNGLFKNCRTLKNITIPNSVISIGAEAFGDCQSLKALEFPKSVISIGKDVIYNHNSLTKIVIPSNVTNIEVGAFRNTNSNEDTIFYVGNKDIKDALIRDGVSEKKIKFIGSGSSSSSHDKDKEEETTTKDPIQTPDDKVTGGETSGTTNDNTPKWEKNSNGKWSYYDSLGNPLKDKWVLDKGNWYYLGSDGFMQVGWTKLNGNWYYLNNNGSMKTGWLKDNEQWYYLTNDGVLKIGWINTGDNWYYLSEDGSMLYNTSVDGYYLDETGAWVH